MSGTENNDKNSWLEILFEKNPTSLIKYNEALAYVQQHFMEYEPDDLFLQIDLDTFCKLFESDDLNVPNEELVFNSVRRWLDFNELNPETHLKQVLKVVRLSLLPTKVSNNIFRYLFDEVEPYVNPISNCRGAFLDVLRYHILDENKINTTVRKYQKIPPIKSKINSNCETTSKMIKPDLKLLSIGGDDLNKANFIEIFDKNLNEWIKPKSLNINKRNYSVALIDDKVMLIGGTRSPDKDIEPLNTVQSLDLWTGILSTENSLNDARQYAAAVVVGKGKTSHLFVLGGQGKENDLDSVEMWDPLSRVWSRQQHMSYKRSGLAAAVIDDKIYVLGGKIDNDYTNTMEAYALDDEIWESKASMKEARAHFCVTVFKGFLYAVAGSKKYLSFVNTFERYDSYDDSWITLANITATGHAGITLLGNKIICAGGKDSKSVLEYDEKNNAWSSLIDLHTPRAGYLIDLPKKMNNLKLNWNDQQNLSGDWNAQNRFFNKLLFLGYKEYRSSKNIEVFDIAKKKWTRMNDLELPFPRTGHSINIIDNKLLVIGGYDGGEHYPLVDAVNLKTGNMIPFPSLKTSREFSSSVVVREGNKEILYVLGGFMNFSKTLASVEKWDPTTNQWTEGVPMISERAGHGCSILNGKIYVVGGQTKETTLNSVEAFDIHRRVWESKAPMSNARSLFGIATFKNYIYVVAGKNPSEAQLNVVERYDPLIDSWTTLANILSSHQVGLCSTGEKLICAGGSKNTVQEYDVDKNVWITLPDVGLARNGFLLGLPENAKLI